MMRLSIGEFSLITSLSIKSLRLYHEKGILVPAYVDGTSGYRYYDEGNVERAKSVKVLKGFEFSLAEIGQLLEGCDDESHILSQLEEKLTQIDSAIDRYAGMSRTIASIIELEREASMETRSEFAIEEKELDTVLIAGHRMTGKYGDIGDGLGMICKEMGRHANGKPMALYYDGEYKEDGADFEACVPVRKGKAAAGISVRELKGGKCVTLIHKGPYEALSDSYQKVFSYINDKGYTSLLPSREVYRKGPGIILKGNPKNYLTEIQIMIEP